MLYLQHFGLTHAPLDKNNPAPLWDDGQQQHWQTRFNWLLAFTGCWLSLVAGFHWLLASTGC